MFNTISREEIRNARCTPLADFLNVNHPGELQQIASGHWQKADNHSVKVNSGISGYIDWSTGDRGNSIDYLIKYLGYSFIDAVKALCETSNVKGMQLSKRHDEIPLTTSTNFVRTDYVLPEKSQGGWSQLYAYLIKTRNIPAKIVKDLVQRGLLYQAANRPKFYNNMVFVSPEKDYYEVHGTNTHKDFYRSCGKTGKECWYFTGEAHTRPARIYVTEAAIDAVSLFVIRSQPDSCYVSIGGAGKQQAVEALKKYQIPVIIATDNDNAGDECRRRNSECETLRPTLHDWNDDLRLGKP